MTDPRINQFSIITHLNISENSTTRQILSSKAEIESRAPQVPIARESPQLSPARPTIPNIITPKPPPYIDNLFGVWYSRLPGPRTAPPPAGK